MAARAGEVALASAQTIGHRSALMRQAHGFDDPEIRRMWEEKAQAAAEIAGAAVTRQPAMPAMWWGWMWQQTMRVVQFTLAAAMCRTPADVAAVQSRFLQTSIATCMDMGAIVARDSIREADRGLRVVGRVAAANARRLSNPR